MAQVTIYLPDELAERLRREAKRSGRSLSDHIATLASGRQKRRSWPRGFDELYGSWQGDFPEIEDLLADERESLR